jgi:alpha-tubulin suppressor-like RCC1 family protein
MHACALRSDGARTCWGNDVDGQAPTGYHLDLLHEALQIATGAYHSCLLYKDHPVECWGANYRDQLEVPDVDDFVQISAGAFHTCGVRKNGRVVCWGDNLDGQSSPP